MMKMLAIPNFLPTEVCLRIVGYYRMLDDRTQKRTVAISLACKELDVDAACWKRKKAEI